MSLPILFTPGPVRTPPLVAEYLANPPVNYHRQDGFRELFAENEADLKALIGLARPEDWFAATLTTTGTGANEACLLALAGLGRGLIVKNGFFGARLVDQAVQAGIPHVVLEARGDCPLDPAAVEAALAGHADLKWAYFVAHETRAGLLNPLAEVGRACKRRGLLVGADVVSAAFAYPIDLEAAQLDLAVTSSAKALMSVPGLGIVYTRREALPRLAEGARRGYYLDLVAEVDKQRREMQPRFAQPVALHAALRAACIHMRRVGVAEHMARIRRQLDEITAFLEEQGAPAALDPAYRSGVASNFQLPRGLEYPEFARRMEALGYYLLYGVPGDMGHFQVSTIGDLSDEHVLGLERALGEVLACPEPAKPPVRNSPLGASTPANRG